MSQIQPASTLDLPAEDPLAQPPILVESRRRRKFGLPKWMRLLLGNPKSRGGLIVLGAVILIALLAPWIANDHPSAFSLDDVMQGPSWAHPFGTSDQGADIFSQVVWGTRRSLLLGAAAA